MISSGRTTCQESLPECTSDRDWQRSTYHAIYSFGSTLLCQFYIARNLHFCHLCLVQSSNISWGEMLSSQQGVSREQHRLRHCVIGVMSPCGICVRRDHAEGQGGSSRLTHHTLQMIFFPKTSFWKMLLFAHKKKLTFPPQAVPITGQRLASHAQLLIWLH